MVTKIEFVDGEKLRDGTATIGTAYDLAVAVAQGGDELPDSQSSYFSEQALDPYEVNNAE